MRIVALFLILTVVSLRTAPAAGQNIFAGDLLASPLIAATTADGSGITLYDVANGARRSLSFGAGWHTVWDFSPDGCRLLFTLSEGSAPARLYSVRLDGSDLRSLVEYPELAPEAWGVWEPDWSPDGARIAFTITRDLTGTASGAPDNPLDFRVAWVAPEGGAPQFYSVSGDEHTPQWSPDSQWLAYVSYEQRAPGADLYSTAEPTAVPPPGSTSPQLPLLREADLWMVSADGERKFRLTYFDTGSVSIPRWSPGGELIGFVYSPIGNNDQFWMVAGQGGAIPTQLSLAWSLALDLTWLPDSSAMLAAVRDFHETAENRLWRIPLVGNADTDATLFVGDPALRYADFPRFSPDGRWLALRSAYSLALVDTTEGTWTLVDEAALGNTAPVWSPAGFAGEAGCL